MARKELWGWIKSLGLAIILALVIRENVLAFYVVDGNSMLPTLENGQMVAVNKLVYNFKAPQHGDIVVFVTNDPRFGRSENRVFIKRVIALPGDTVEIAGGTLYLNGQAVEEEYIDTPMDKDYGPLLIQPGFIFVMGDNRHPTGSWDSREFGPIHLQNIIGRAEFILFPLPSKLH